MSDEGLESSIVHVFHPTDFSEASWLAFAHALRVALLARAALTLFHVDRDGEDAGERTPALGEAVAVHDEPAGIVLGDVEQRGPVR